MNIRDKLLKFKRYAIASHTGLYNEDSTTASALVMECNKKVAECLEFIIELQEDVNKIKDQLNITYAEESEELTLTIAEKVTAIQDQVNASYVCLVDEDSMTAIEQAGKCAQGVNECLKAINMMGELIAEINDKVGLDYDSNEEMLTITGGLQ